MNADSLEQAAEADSELLAACRRGDVEAWKRFYSEHFDFVHRTARRLGALPGEAEDIVQETFVVAWKKLRSFQSGRVTTWLFRITANLTSGYHRRRRVRELFAGRREPEVHSPGPDEEVGRAELRSQVADVLSRMAPKKREVLALYELEGLEGEKIAELLQCKLATVWTRLHYARADFERIGRKRGLFEDGMPLGRDEDGDVHHG